MLFFTFFTLIYFTALKTKNNFDPFMNLDFFIEIEPHKFLRIKDLKLIHDLLLHYVY